MDSENQSVATETAAAPEAVQAPDQTSSIATSSKINLPTGSEVKAEPPYTPNFKVKAYDNEYEIPEGFRGYINKDNEKNFREVFEKFYAVDVMKDKLQKTRGENESLSKTKSEYDTLSKSLSGMSRYIEEKDYDSFFNALKIDEKDLQKWMYEKLRQGELPPDQQAIFQKNNEYRQSKYQLEAQNEEFRNELNSLKEQQTQFSIAKRGQELDSIINRPEILSVAQSFDSRLGQPGAFRSEVISRAAFEFQNSGKDLSAEEAVNNAMKIVAWNQQSSSEQGDKVIPPQAGQKKPTLPSMQGKATSPVSQKITSLDDLKRLRSQSIRIENN